MQGYNKFIVAAVGALAYFVANAFGLPFDQVLPALTAVAVWAIPNQQ